MLVEQATPPSACQSADNVAGLLDLGTSSHLIAITKREQVAQIRGQPVYALREVTLIPLDSQAEAQKAVANAQKSLKQDPQAAFHADDDATEESDVGEDAETSTLGGGDEGGQEPAEVAALEPPKGGVVKRGSTFVKNVVQDRGKYGRFAEKWFSKGGGWKSNGRRKQELSTQEDLGQALETDRGVVGQVDKKEQLSAEPHPAEESEQKNEIPKQSQEQSVMKSLTPRILRSAKLYFSTSGFFFSYDHDISGTLMQRSHETSSLPLWKRFDSTVSSHDSEKRFGYDAKLVQYFWNRHLINSFIAAGRNELVLPLLQGFVGQRAFSISRTEGTKNDTVAGAAQEPSEVVAARSSKNQAPEEALQSHDFLLTLISRRSIKRAGLRYLRRGVDGVGNVANSVETEQILSTPSWSRSERTFSLLQTRGSLPLFFSQSPYSFKPVPITHGSEATNQGAFKKHFTALSARYGKIQAVSLVDKHGTEVSIGESYEKYVQQLNDKGGVGGEKIGFEWFDFHTACKGMKFENVSILMEALDSCLKSFGWIVKQDDRNIRQQTGILRTNCMDCLDRTNVVQSAVAGWALEQQLGELGLKIDLKSDAKTQWFNTLWADNGDYISKQYAGTAALKGDFTRTRKRDWTGALSDFSLTLNRYYNNIFGDYFLQTCIDYYLGHAGPAIFEEFETDMMSKDYALDVRRIRQNAIETCIKIVLEDPAEKLAAGWTLSCPKETNTLRTLPFEECVVLLTDKAFYFCRFDWDTEKVGSFERVDLLDISEVWRGAYITSTLGPIHLDENKNTGFVLKYKTTDKGVKRSNTRSLQSDDNAKDEKPDESKDEKQDELQDKLLAFKALPPQASAAKDDTERIAILSETQLVKHICDEVQKVVNSAMRKDRGSVNVKEEDLLQVEEKEVISVTDARKSTGYMESIGYSLKRLVWS